MSGISQTIPAYIGGISEQPDYIKPLGTVKDAVNVVPDITYGLYKRLGAKRITENPLTISNDANCKWFHYYRSADEGSYLGQIDNAGEIKMWNMKATKKEDGTVVAAGSAATINWQTTDQYGGNIGASSSEADAKTAMKNYLKDHTDNNTPANQASFLKSITINDTTFLSHQGVEVDLESKASDSRIHNHYAFVELRKTENGRQYGLDVCTPDSTPQNYWTATRLRVERGGPSTAGTGNGQQGSCPHVGTRIHTAPANRNWKVDTSGGGWVEDANHINKELGYYPEGSNSGSTSYISGRNLVFRLTVTGQQGTKPNAGTINGSDDYTCTYTLKADLLHGGWGWISAEKQYEGSNNNIVNEYYIGEGGTNGGRNEAGWDTTNYNSTSGYLLMGARYKIHIDDAEKYRAPVISDNRGVHDGSSWNDRRPHNLSPGFIRPDPTPFDSETATSATTILGSIARVFDNTYELANGWKEGGNTVSHINVTASNTGLSKPGPAVTITGGGGVGAEARCIMDDDGTGNGTYKIAAIEVTNPGWNFTSAPTVTVSGGTATAVLTTEKDYSPIKADIIGNGIYLYSDSEFTVKVVEPDLMRVVTDNTNDVSGLPNQCRHGYLIKVTNSQDTRADDYWLKFEAYNGIDGPGQWVESLHPDMRYRPDGATLPHILQRTDAGVFKVDEFDWTDRTVGDNLTNPRPYFINQPANAHGPRYIYKVLYWRNRLALSSGDMLDLSAPNDLGNMWRHTALTTGPNDAIHIKNSQNFPAQILQGVEVPTGLVLFTENEQFLMYSADGTVTPESLVIVPLSAYFSNKNLEPVSLGTTIGFIDNSGRNSRFMEMAQIRTDTEPFVFEHSKAVPTLMPKDIDIIDISRDNNMIFFGKSDTDTVFVYRWFAVGESRKQSSWVKWKFNRPLKYFFITDDTFYFVDADKFLQKINLISGSEDATVTQEDIDWNVHLDNWIEVTPSGGYDPPSNKTTFPASWLSSVNNVTAKIAIVDPVNGNYDECEIDGTNIKAPGNWSTQVNSVTITNGGSGYTSAPTVTFSGGSTSSTFQAQATATVTNGVVTAVNITDPGYNYTGTPTIAFSGGGGSSAAATAVTSDKRYIGYLYDMEVKFPKIYPVNTKGNTVVADVNSSLVLHRLNIAFGRVGGYTFELDRVGKDTYTENYSSTPADAYEAGDVPYLLEEIRTIPVYDKNTNVTVTLKSTNPSPATLRSMSWEGDYTNKNYKRG